MEEYRAELDPERNAGGQTNIFPVHNFFPKLKMAAAAILDLLGSHGTTHEGTLVVRILPVKISS